MAEPNAEDFVISDTEEPVHEETPCATPLNRSPSGNADNFSPGFGNFDEEEGEEDEEETEAERQEREASEFLAGRGSRGGVLPNRRNSLGERVKKIEYEDIEWEDDCAPQTPEEFWEFCDLRCEEAGGLDSKAKSGALLKCRTKYPNVTQAKKHPGKVWNFKWWMRECAGKNHYNCPKSYKLLTDGEFTEGQSDPPKYMKCQESVAEHNSHG
jgi:hypothetical protein